MRKQVILIGLIMLLGLSACSMPKLVKIDPTATPKPSLPTEVPTENPTPTAEPAATLIPEPTAEPTSPAESSGIPEDLAGHVTRGMLLLDETFDRRGSWTISSGSEFGSEIVDGTYQIYMDKPQWMVWAESGKISTDDVIVDLDVKLADGASENNQGLMCRYTDDQNFYAMTIGNDGWVEILKVFNGEQIQLFGEFFTSEIDPVSNHLQGFCIGERLLFYANGALLADVNDSDLQFGDVGVIIGSFDDPKVTIRFDNLVVSEALEKVNLLGDALASVQEDLGINLETDWKQEFSDSFEDPSAGTWDLISGGPVLSEYRNDRFAFEITKSDITAFSVTNALWLRNVVLDTEAYRMDDSSENDMGFICRYQDSDNFYSLSFGNDNYVTIYKTINGEWISLFNEFVDYDLSDAHNRITAACIDTSLALYANGHLLARAFDSELQEGDVGFLVGTYDDTSFSVEFDDFIVFTPK